MQVKNCYNFDEHVILSCTNCQNISIFDSSFKSISKTPDYRGGESGFFNFDNQAKIFMLFNSSFRDIVTEGNMI